LDRLRSKEGVAKIKERLGDGLLGEIKAEEFVSDCSNVFE